MKVIFLGTPDFALPSLQAIYNSTHKIVGVVTQPDKPVGRSNKLVPTPVKKLALSLGLPVYQYEKISRDGVQELSRLGADIMVTCAYGQMLSQEVLDLCPHGVINVHGSLLPKYRGAAPIQWAIINGDKITGITILKTMIGMDDGPIILKRETPVKEYETSGELFERLSILGSECIVDALDSIQNGTATFTPQDESQAVKCKMLKPTMSAIDWSQDCNSVANLIHGLNPWPTAKCVINGVHFKLFRCVTCNYDEGVPGEIVVSSNKLGLVVRCGKGAVQITEFQPENGKRMNPKDYLNGKAIPLHSKVTNE